ncbi:hypothetical protein [Nocardia amamiensis]|uniref:hypothetical protein n=1 Tax=Nocardia amamiensis TaxID=404578 RepID=UPI0012F4816E|nr:hypothetical protein [Nocardia amamiensis]
MSGWRRYGRSTWQPSRRSRLESLVERLQLQDGWTVDELVTSVERMRGRRIVRAPLPENAPVGLFGLWLARPADDVVLYRKSSDPLMERHVVAHEVAHMLLEHGSRTSPGEPATSLVGVDVGRGLGSSVSTMQAARGASAYDDECEYEAELLATLILTGDRRKGILRRDRMTSEF